MKSEWLGSFLFGLPVGLLILAGMKDLLSWGIVGVCVAALCFFAVLVFPYFTKFIPSKTKEEH